MQPPRRTLNQRRAHAMARSQTSKRCSSETSSGSTRSHSIRQTLINLRLRGTSDKRWKNSSPPMVTSIRGPSANSKPELQTSSASRSEPTMTFVRLLERQSSTETTSSQVREAKGSTIKTSTTAKELCKTCVKARNKRSMVCKEIRH